MNEYADAIPNNVKIIVRIRNHPTEKDKYNDTEESVSRVERSNTPSRSKESSISSKPVGKSNTKDSKTKSRSKSPSLGGSNKTSTPVLKSSGLEVNKKYTIFTSISPSNTIVITNKPISGKLINDTFMSTSDLYEYSYSIIKDATLLEYERVYNESHKLDIVYNEQMKECISNMFLGKNSCLLMFGPTDSGKSFTLRGGKDSTYGNEIGVLGRGIQDLFNLVEISKQANLNSKGKGAMNFSVKMSVYQVYLDQVNDLLTNQFSKSLKVEKYYDSENNLCSHIVDLVQKEVRSKKDYDHILKEAMQYRKLIAQTLRVNEMKRKSHLVISLILEKRERVHEGVNKTAEKTLDIFAQIDFVELAASNYGLANLNSKIHYDPSQWDDLLYKNTSKVFNSICNNIVSASIGISPKYDTKLTLALKNTLRSDSQIIFVSCVMPFEQPPEGSFKCLKFTNWLRNQVHNIKCNRDYQIKSQFEDSAEEAKFTPSGDDDFRKRTQKILKGRSNFSGVERGEKDQNRNYLSHKDQGQPKDYLEDEEGRNYREPYNHNTIGNNEPQSSNDELEIRQLRERMKKKYPQIEAQGLQDRKCFNTLKSNYNQEGSSSFNNMNIISHNNNVDQSYISNSHASHKEEKLKDVEKSLRDLEAKSLEMSRCIENMRVERGRVNSYYNEDSNLMNIKTSSQSIDFDFERMKSENATLKSDNIIFREDINRLSDMTRHLEDELSRQRNRNLDLAADNERISQEKLAYKNEIDKLNENVSRVKVQEHNLMDQMNQRFMFENKIREFETENKNLRDEKQRFEVDFKVLTERHSELRKQYDNTENELNFLKVKQTEEVNHIESKLEKMAKEIEFLQRENNSLRSNEERLRTELISMEKQRDNYRDKYQEYKAKNNVLNVKLNEIEDDFRKIMLEKQVESFEKKKEEESKKNKIDSKHKILEDMQSRISSYKTELLRQRNKKDEF